MNGYTKLFNSIITSTIWQEDDKTRIVWITLLALSDFQGNVEGSIPGLANLARISTEDCEKSLAKLKQPDPYSRSKEKEGRRIEDVEGGWHIINYVLYRERNIDRKAYNRMKQQQYRSQEKESTKEKEGVTHTHTQGVYNNVQNVHTCNTPFERFWEIYPRKEGKTPARKSFEKISPDDQLLAKILAAVENRKKTPQWQKDGGQFIPLPATWLNQERWTDETEIKNKPVIDQQVVLAKRKEKQRDSYEKYFNSLPEEILKKHMEEEQYKVLGLIWLLREVLDKKKEHRIEKEGY
jgi:hypothetical protein